MIAPCTASRSVTSRSSWSRGDHVVAGALAAAHEIDAELAAGTGDQHPHQKPALAFSGSHHARLSRYHSTVAASPSTRLCSVFQPSAVTLSWVIE